MKGGGGGAWPPGGFEEPKMEGAVGGGGGIPDGLKPKIDAADVFTVSWVPNTDAADGNEACKELAWGSKAL